MNGEVFCKLTCRLGVFYQRKNSIACSSYLLLYASMATVFKPDFELHHAIERNVTQSWIQTGIGSGPDPPPACLS